MMSIIIVFWESAHSQVSTHACIVMHGVNVAAFVQMYCIYILGKRPAMWGKIVSCI